MLLAYPETGRTWSAIYWWHKSDMTAHDLAVVTFEKTLMHCLVATAKEHTKSVVTWHIWDIHSWEIPNMGGPCVFMVWPVATTLLVLGGKGLVRRYIDNFRANTWRFVTSTSCHVRWRVAKRAVAAALQKQSRSCVSRIMRVSCRRFWQCSSPGTSRQMRMEGGWQNGLMIFRISGLKQGGPCRTWTIDVNL